MIAMNALVSFNDPDLASLGRPNGAVAANSPFNAPRAEVADRLEAAGLAVREKVAPKPAASKAD